MTIWYRIIRRMARCTSAWQDECVGLGTDFDGISGEFEISDCTKLPLLFDALRKRGLSEDAVEQIAYQNTARVIRDGMR